MLRLDYFIQNHHRMGEAGKVSRAEKFFTMCTTLPFPEYKDSRDETHVPELVHVAELRDAGNMQDAIDYGRSLMLMYPDFDLIAFMLGYIYYQQDFPKEALDVVVSALKNNCPRKYRLYAVGGLAEFKRGNLPEAIVWWSRSVIAQCTVLDFQESDPFLHMAHAADLIGHKREAQMLFTMTDAIENGGPRLAGDELSRLAMIKDSWAREPFSQVLKHIDKQYLHTAK